ncbi:MAG: YjbQ family protein [Deltaproteobacteria bacterium]|nr:YjbQ family protein [Deltaproteobacteria bacterium]
MTTPAGQSAVRWEDKGSDSAGLGGVHVRRLEVQTSKRMEIHDLTETVREMVRATGITAGLVTVSTMHTTTAVFVNEPQTALLDDIQHMLERLVPRAEEWKHNDPRYSDCDRQNADAHLRAIMLGSSVTLQVAEGALTMGQWQRVLMAELDGPRKRGLVLQVLVAS